MAPKNFNLEIHFLVEFIFSIRTKTCHFVPLCSAGHCCRWVWASNQLIASSIRRVGTQCKKHYCWWVVLAFMAYAVIQVIRRFEFCRFANNCGPWSLVNARAIMERSFTLEVMKMLIYVHCHKTWMSDYKVSVYQLSLLNVGHYFKQTNNCCWVDFLIGQVCGRYSNLYIDNRLSTDTISESIVIPWMSAIMRAKNSDFTFGYFTIGTEAWKFQIK